MSSAVESKPQARPAVDKTRRLRPGSALAVFLLCAVALAAYMFKSSLGIGFLLDDFFHVDYLIRAFSGKPQVLYSLFWSNWSPDTTLTSYRPLVSISLAGDYAIWHINAIGYHLTNILIFTGCTALVGLITKDLCDLNGTRRATAAATVAACLFAVYPLHPEAVAWIIGRVDLLCTLFYLGSIYCYLRHRETNQKVWLIGSLVSFLAALMSKEMAVTLPAVLTALEWSLQKRVCLPPAVRAHWAMLIVFAAFRTVVLGTVVGGYGATGWKAIKQGWHNFRDVATLQKVLFGWSEELAAAPQLRTAAFFAWAALLVNILFAKRNWRMQMFLATWVVLSVLPTFQIWHIWPNLVGSRLFFLGSAPLCMIAGVAAASVSGIAAATILGITWCCALQSNLSIWITAADRLAEFRGQLNTYLPKLSAQSKLLIPALPQDFKGAPVLGRPEYLTVICKPPFATADYTDRILTLEPVIAGGMEFIGPQAYRAAREKARFVLDWRDTESESLRQRLNEKPSAAPLISIEPPPPFTLAERYQRLHQSSSPNAPVILKYDAGAIANARYAKVYIGKSWQPLGNALRAVPPDQIAVEFESDFLPAKGSFPCPNKLTEGAHDVVVLAFDVDRKSVGLVSETAPIILRAAE